MQTRVITRSLFILFVSLFALASCQLPGSAAVDPTATSAAVDDDPPDPEATETPEAAPDPTATPTATPTGIVVGSGSSDPGSGYPGPGDPGSGYPGPGGQAGVDPCLVGLWAADNESMAAYLTRALNQGGEVDFFTVTEITGALFLSFSAEGKMAVASEDFLITVVFAPSENLTVDMQMVLVAAGEADYTADGQTITNTNRNYASAGLAQDAVLEAVSGGESVITMEVDPSWFLATASDNTDDPNTGAYVCSLETLHLTSNPHGPVQFNRVEE